MKKTVYILAIAAIITILSCNTARYRTVKQVKPLNRNRLFDRKKDKGAKRTHIVKRKSLVRSPEIKPPRKKKRKQPKRKTEVQSDSTQQALPKTAENEADSTGSF